MPAETKTVENLVYLPAVAALRCFRAREVSPVELMAATIARAEAVEPVVNAFTYRFFDEAMAAARRAEARYLGKGGRPRPLEGLPVAIKEEMPVAGQPNTSASLVYADHVAGHSAPLAERVLAAGGIIHARTTQPEFACAAFTHSRLFGITRNPWNPAFDVGGSSGGAGASLAVGTTALAGGSDIAGSIRIPAACCGVVGFKPPYGRVPQHPPFALDHYCHEGPLARTVADCALFENVIAGPHPVDPAAVHQHIRLPLEPEGIADWRLALSVDLGGWGVDGDVAANTRAAADALREAGATVEEVELGWDRAAIIEAAAIHYAAVFAPFVAEVAAEHGDRLTPYALRFAELAAELEPGAFLRGLAIEGEVFQKLNAVLSGYRALLCPTLAIPALPAGFDDLTPLPGTSGLSGWPDVQHMMTIPFNIASRCPALSIPSGLAGNGVPTGLQIVGRPFQDAVVFRVAAALERVHPWLDVPERRPRLQAA